MPQVGEFNCSLNLRDLALITISEGCHATVIPNGDVCCEEGDLVKITYYDTVIMYGQVTDKSYLKDGVNFPVLQIEEVSVFSST